MIDFVGKRYWYFLFSLLIIVPGTISLLIFGLRLGIDFTGGTLWRMRFEQPVQASQLLPVLAELGHGEAQIQSSENNTLLVRTKEIPAPPPTATEEERQTLEKERIATAVRGRLGPFVEESFESVGPAIGTEIAQRSVLAITLASLGILAYVAFAFRKMPGPFRYGACAIAALLHDALLTLGVFSILGVLFHYEVSALFVTAVLTTLGFSVHDTIVVFDRIRENMTRRAGENFEQIVNHSLAQTLVRSLSTSLTVLFTLLAIFLFGGVSTREFALALLIGIISGTYSSIFNASQLLIVWETGEWRNWFGGRGATVTRAA
ncbi:MAG: protein translocase subunit SecF [Chloroflexi bacterium]|nr:protein translocase subunit SecF [Chloroflexota bacterium]